MSKPKPPNKRLQRLEQKIEVGNRVKLIRAKNKGINELIDGDIGTVVDITRLPESLGGNRQIWVIWKRSYGNFKVAMIEHEDSFTVLD